jgi:hypothetical protein
VLLLPFRGNRGHTPGGVFTSKPPECCAEKILAKSRLSILSRVASRESLQYQNIQGRPAGQPPLSAAGPQVPTMVFFRIPDFPTDTRLTILAMRLLIWPFDAGTLPQGSDCSLPNGDKKLIPASQLKNNQTKDA